MQCKEPIKNKGKQEWQTQPQETTSESWPSFSSVSPGDNEPQDENQEKKRKQLRFVDFRPRAWLQVDFLKILKANGLVLLPLLLKIPPKCGPGFQLDRLHDVSPGIDDTKRRL
jgi:hypothetical protein